MIARSAGAWGRGIRRGLRVGLASLLAACGAEEMKPGTVRLVDAWQPTSSITGTPVPLTLENVTRPGIPLRPNGSPERFDLRVPPGARLNASLGVAVWGEEDSENPVLVELEVSICGVEGDADASDPLARFEVEGAGWHPVDLALDFPTADEIELCIGAFVAGPEAAQVLPVLAEATVANPESAPFPSGQPNLLIITLDTTRADHLGSAGYGRNTSPHLDRLAADGEQYLNAVTNSSWTLPSHASLFTGKHPREHGARSHVLGQHALVWKFFGLPESELTVADRLWNLGYRTGAVVAGTVVSAEFGLAQGFEFYDETPRRGSSASADSVVFDERGGDEVTDLALAWLKNANRPFFLFLNYFDPHWPFEPPADAAAVFVRPETAQLEKSEYLSIWQEVMLDQKDLRSEERQAMVDLYDAEIFSMDRALGRLFEALRASGDYDRTMIVVVSDHGEAFGEHRTVDHGVSLYEEQLRAALIVKYPKRLGGHARSGRFEHRVDLLDLHATVLRELGLARGSEAPVKAEEDVFEGSFASRGLHKQRAIHYAELNRNPWTVGAYGARFDRDLEAVYRGRFKLIRSDRGRVELYDLEADPKETENLVEVEVEVARELEEALDAWGEAWPWQVTTGEAIRLSPGLREQLEALGYGTEGRSGSGD